MKKTFLPVVALVCLLGCTPGKPLPETTAGKAGKIGRGGFPTGKMIGVEDRRIGTVEVAGYEAEVLLTEYQMLFLVQLSIRKSPTSFGDFDDPTLQSSLPVNARLMTWMLTAGGGSLPLLEHDRGNFTETGNIELGTVRAVSGYIFKRTTDAKKVVGILIRVNKKFTVLSVK